MGGAVAHGLVKCGCNPADICLANPHARRLEPFRALGVCCTENNVEAVRGADVVIVAVKPWILPQVAAELASHVDAERQELGVIVAGVDSESLRAMWAGADGTVPPLSIVMPNTAVALAQSMTFLVSVQDHTPRVEELFGALGSVRVIEERLLGAATALASCGIAYALRYVRAATEGGVELGFRASEAQDIVAQTMAGAAALLREPGAHAEVEIDRVTTPGGITIRGLNAMEAQGFTNSVIAGLKASVKA